MSANINDRNIHAQRLFDGVARQYDVPAQVLSPSPAT